MRSDFEVPELIVLVDGEGRPIGSAEKTAAHHSATPLHLGFSCYLFDERGHLLVTRRAAGKKVWPGVWSNSVCGHPAPGEEIVDAIRRRLRYELGMTAGALEAVLPHYRYRAPPFQGIVENEFCPVYAGRAASQPRPNPAEVDAYEWMPWGDFVQATEEDAADAYSWWCKNQMEQLKHHPRMAAFARPEA